MSLTISFGERVKDVRSSMNISQEQLAVMANISRTHMGRIERGDKSPTIETVGKIAKALNCPPSIFFVSE